MSKQIEKEIVELVTKWYSSKVAFPNGWSDEKYLASSEVSYKTYDSGSIRYVTIELVINGTTYALGLRGGTVEIAGPITKRLSPKSVLEILNAIYTEATSIESMVEGKVKIRKDIADKRIQIKRLNKEIKTLEESLEKTNEM